MKKQRQYWKENEKVYEQKKKVQSKRLNITKYKRSQVPDIRKIIRKINRMIY